MNSIPFAASRRTPQSLGSFSRAGVYNLSRRLYLAGSNEHECPHPGENIRRAFLHTPQFTVTPNSILQDTFPCDPIEVRLSTGNDHLSSRGVE